MTASPASTPGAAPHPVVADLSLIVGPRGVLADADELRVYECDGFPIAKGLPTAVVFPTGTGQVAACVRAIARHNLPIIPRGSGTGLAGGAVAYGSGVIVCTSRMTTIESIDLANRAALVQAGVRNWALSEAAIAESARAGLPGPLYFSPDPSSQRACTIGGNVATNAGGINTLKHGVTTNHILGLEMVLADGSILTTRAAPLHDGLGANLPALITGSEGVLGIITRVWCRLSPRPLHFRTIVAVFDESRDGYQSVADVIASGILPTSMEFMDGAMIRIVEEAFRLGFPTTAQSLLLIEIDGVPAALDEQLPRICDICRANHARDIQHCSDPKRRLELWAGRKKAFGAIGRISRSYCTQDACVPRSLLPTAMARIVEIGTAHGLKINSVFHAGDGNVHPILLFDEDDPAQVQRVLAASEEILEYCIGIGGTITGEHGVGVEKLNLMPRMFSADTLAAFKAVKHAFDGEHRINEGKLIPSDRLVIELVRPVAPNTPGGAL